MQSISAEILYILQSWNFVPIMQFPISHPSSPGNDYFILCLWFDWSRTSDKYFYFCHGLFPEHMSSRIILVMPCVTILIFLRLNNIPLPVLPHFSYPSIPWWTFALLPIFWLLWIFDILLLWPWEYKYLRPWVQFFSVYIE